MTLDICSTCKSLICECPTDDNKEAWKTAVIEGLIVEGSYQKKHEDDPRSAVNMLVYSGQRPSPLKTCEVCSAEGDWFKHDAMYMCPDCRNKEMTLQAESAKHADERVAQMHEDSLQKKAIEKVIPKELRQLDTTLAVKEEFFNIERISIVDKKKEIDADESISEKHYTLAKWLKERMLSDRHVLFDLDEARVKVTSGQRADQQYMNDLLIKVSRDKREEFKQKDLEYKPAAPVIKERKAKPKKTKFDKKEIFKLAKEFGIPEFAIQTVCVSKNIQPVEAIKWIKENQG